MLRGLRIASVLTVIIILATIVAGVRAGEDVHAGLRAASFTVDVSPTVNEPIGLGFIASAKTIEHPLLAKGVVLRHAEGTYVLCAIDWMEVHNSSYDALRRRIGTAAGTSASRVALHTLHQHTGPAVDADAQRLTLTENDPRRMATAAYERRTAESIETAVGQALGRLQLVTHPGRSQAKVERVASNRRLKQADGSIVGRMSSTKDAKLQAAPEGVIDPWLKTLTFSTNGKPLVQIHYYATHPQSFYGDGRLSYDTVGIARERLQQATGVTQIYFTGCGGDIAMGKYNDGTPKARQALTDRLYDAMRRSIADERTERISNVRWEQAGIAFTKRRDPAFQRPANVAILANAKAMPIQRLKAGITLAWIKRSATRPPVEMSCLAIDGVRILHLPGEPFVQYQLAAQKMQPNAFVVVAGYGDCGMGYIGGDRIFTDRGGYEQTYSFAGPSEGVLLETMERLLEGAD